MAEAARSHHARKPEELETILEEEKGDSILGRVKAKLNRDPNPKGPPKPSNRPPAGHPNVEEIGEIVALANMPLALLAPRDALTDVESKKLIEGLHTYSQTSDAARRFMYGIVRGSALLALAEIGMGIALPRMIRHGLLPVGIAPYVTNLCDAAQLADACGITLGSENGANPDAWSRPGDIPARPAA
jgi:hypothetical protein